VSDEHVQDLFTGKMKARVAHLRAKRPKKGAAVHVFTAFTADDDLDDEEAL
jgi:hypothetical protein